MPYDNITSQGTVWSQYTVVFRDVISSRQSLQKSTVRITCSALSDYLPCMLMMLCVTVNCLNLDVL